ncbi:phage protein GemA/Gp16 family protein [Halarcobacter sp.]|uniref:phage protein GemA/Gp16 family protein n=1 Tax=Halarcobacter sp. TaxID=2321133 RepID=UPI0029F525CF|nr:phage protein GemA/Gp16 family protein [Halarcobacter sp.]
MTPKQKEYKQNLITKIQINKGNVFNNEDERKEFMQSRFAAESLKDMSIDQLKLLLDFCYRKVSDIPMLKRDKDRVTLITDAQKKKIRVLWKEKARDKSEEALMKLACKIAGYKASRIDAFKTDEAQSIILALEYMG